MAFRNMAGQAHRNNHRVRPKDFKS